MSGISLLEKSAEDDGDRLCCIDRSRSCLAFNPTLLNLSYTALPPVSLCRIAMIGVFHAAWDSLILIPILYTAEI